MERWRHISRPWQKGFTLIELVIVLAIMAILSGTTLATARGIQRRTLNNTSLSIQADLRRAQRLALIEGRRWRVNFDIENNRYFMHPMPRNFGDHVYTVYLPRGVEIDHITAPQSRTFLEYLPRGTASSGFGIHLRNGPYLQRLTATVSAGRIAIFDIERLLD